MLALAEVTPAKDKRVLLAELESLLQLKAERNLSIFFRQAWKVLNPGRPLLHSWHHDATAEYLTACHLRQIKQLLITMPPRYVKSILASVCYPTWTWITKPERRFLSASYSQSLSTKHSVDRRTLIQSAWYQDAWGDRFQLADDENLKQGFMNDKRGHMIATSMHGTATGKGGDDLIFDDPHDTTRAVSDVKRAADVLAFDQKFASRLDDKENGVRIIVMQRLHDRDVAGHVLNEGGWEHLNLPAEAPTKTIITFPISKRTIVREEGAILHPEREGPRELSAMKKKLGSAGYQSQYQQDPRPMKGGFFPRKWWQRWRELPIHRMRTIQFWDCAEKPGVSNDYSVCATWIEAPSGFFIIDLWREKVTFPDLERACRDLWMKHKPDAIVVEDKSAGVQLIQSMADPQTLRRLDLKRPLPVIAWQPGQRDKVVRATAAQPMVEAGNVWIPHAAAWAEDFLKEHEKFPTVDHDDQVDTTSQAADWFKGHAGAIARVRSAG